MRRPRPFCALLSALALALAACGGSPQEASDEAPLEIVVTVEEPVDTPGIDEI